MPTDIQILQKGEELYAAGKNEQALRCFLRAAEMGNAKAQNLTGLFYHDGIGGEQNYALALEWYQKAAEQNEPYALGNMAVMYHMGQGVTQDFAKACQLYEKAITLGNTNDTIQNNLAVLYMDGKGTEKDYQKAQNLLEKAIAQGNEKASENYQVLEKLKAVPTWKELRASSASTIGMLLSLGLGIVLFIAMLNEGNFLSALFCLVLFSAITLAIFHVFTSEKGKQEIKKREAEKLHKRLNEGYLCPNCGMNAGHPMGLGKGFSIFVFGIFSNSIGKTYECANCHYKW